MEAIKKLIDICNSGEHSFQEVIDNKVVCKILNLNSTPRCQYLTDIAVDSYDKQRDLTQKPAVKYVCAKDYVIKNQ